MNRLLILPVLLLTLLVGNPAVSADYQKGLDAARRGDYATALREWKPLAKQGDARAQTYLAEMYDNGEGVRQNKKTAVKWWRLAAEQGFANAQYHMGLVFANGEGVRQNKKTAIKWWRLAAEQGYTLAQFNLGVMYGNGIGVKQDNVFAQMWWIIAALSGYKDAVKYRDIVSGMMTPSQLETARKLARECFLKKYKGC